MKLHGKIKFKKFNNYYEMIESSNQQLFILGLFLTDDYQRNPNFFKNWLNNYNQNTGGNVTILIKENQNIIIGWDISDTFLKLEKEIFLNLLNEWDKILKEKPDEVTITWDGKEVRFDKKFKN